MSMTVKKIVNTEYLITRKVVMIEYHRVEANSKAEAIRMVEKGGDEDYETYYSEQYKPKFDSILLTYECPFIHNGWTSVAWDVEIGSFGWHYNGMCKGGYQDEETGMCHVCVEALKKGYRMLRKDELEHIRSGY